jgi:hypothetical protein
MAKAIRDALLSVAGVAASAHVDPLAGAGMIPLAGYALDHYISIRGTLGRHRSERVLAVGVARAGVTPDDLVVRLTGTEEGQELILRGLIAAQDGAFEDKHRPWIPQQLPQLPPISLPRLGVPRAHTFPATRIRGGQARLNGSRFVYRLTFGRVGARSRVSIAEGSRGRARRKPWAWLTCWSRM